MPTNPCYTADDISTIGGTIVENTDGSVSVYVPSSVTSDLVPLSLTKPCCEQLGLGYIFDIDTQKCLWSRLFNPNLGCSLDSQFNIVLNPTGNDGSIFYVDTHENCTLSIDFDYLFNIKCETLLNIMFPTFETAVCNSLVEAFESLDVSMTLDVVSGTTNVSIYENNFFPAIGSGNLYTYVSGHSGTTGFYVCGQLLDTSTDTSCHALIIGEDSELNCGTVGDSLIDGLWIESGLSGDPSGITTFENNIHTDSFNSNWTHFHIDVTDPSVISQIVNQKIKITLKVNHTCADFCVLLDNIVLNKNCSVVDNNDIFITKSPGFELDRIRDNKKSWIYNTDLEHREFNIFKEDGTYPIRPTDYFINDERLLINTKEIDLDVSLATAIETDVWCYIVDNPCILTGTCECPLYVGLTGTNITGGSVTLPYSMRPTGTNCSTIDTFINLYKNNVRLEETTCGDIIKIGPYNVTAGTETGIWFANETDGTVGIYLGVTASGSTTMTHYTVNGVDDVGLDECSCNAYNDLLVYVHGLDGRDFDTYYWDINSKTCRYNKSCNQWCGDECIDLNELLTQPLSAITTIEDFEYFLTSELIDAKNRKTLSGYPTLRLLYDRYINSNLYCSTNSSRFDYLTMDQFAGLIGDYWVDIVEQVIPATTIWGSTKIYSNTIFDQQKYKYKAYTLQLCGNPFSGETVLSPVTITGDCADVDVIYTTIMSQLKPMQSALTSTCSNVCVAQMNSGSEFIGTVTVVGPDGTITLGDGPISLFAG